MGETDWVKQLAAAEELVAQLKQRVAAENQAERDDEFKRREELKKTASSEIAFKLALIDTLLQECENIAADAGVQFSWDGPSYGMGGYFDGSWQSSSYSC
jgi:5'-deoxynucleotidase YfbR-like HD superfamily hydrolase